MGNTELGDHKRSNQFLVLVDSDAFIGWMVERDPHHQRANEIFQRLLETGANIVTTSLVVFETATVLSHWSGQTLAKTFLEAVIEDGQFPIIHIDEGFYQAVSNIFKSQSKKGTSMTDCANVAIMRKFNIPFIFSFDKVYPNKFGLKLAESL